MPHNQLPGRSSSHGKGTKPAVQSQLKESPSTRQKKMTREEFKEWLKSSDRDGNGNISRDELRAALKGLGMNFTGWKSWRAMVHADLNQNNSVEGDEEIEELIKYAAKRWGIVVT